MTGLFYQISQDGAEEGGRGRDVEHDDEVESDEENGHHIGDDNLAVEVVEIGYRAVDVESDHQEDEADDAQHREDDLECPGRFLERG